MGRGVIVFSSIFITVFFISLASAGIFQSLTHVTGKVIIPNEFERASSCGNGFLDSGELCDYAATNSENNPYGDQCTSGCWVDGEPPYWDGCRGSGVHVCTDNPRVTDQYFVNHPDCIPNPTCDGFFFYCNGVVCPEPSVSTSTTPSDNTTTSSVCIDSDNGINPNVKGKVTVNSITAPDYCFEVSEGSSAYVAEQYCEGNLVKSKTLRCDNSCFDGACVISTTSTNTTTSSACTDSDGGENYYVKGRTSAQDGAAEDYCILGAGNTFRYVAEYYCKDNSILTKTRECENGCSNGACIPTTTTTNETLTCTDSDGGKNAIVKGTITIKDPTGRTKLYTDFCKDAMNLGEYTCLLSPEHQTVDNAYNLESIFCTKGCSDGFCIVTTTTNETGFHLKAHRATLCRALTFSPKSGEIRCSNVTNVIDSIVTPGDGNSIIISSSAPTIILGTDFSRSDFYEDSIVVEGKSRSAQESPFCLLVREDSDGDSIYETEVYRDCTDNKRLEENVRFKFKGSLKRPLMFHLLEGGAMEIDYIGTSNLVNTGTPCSVEKLSAKTCTHLGVDYGVRRGTGCHIRVSYGETEEELDINPLESVVLKNGVELRNPSACTSNLLDLFLIGSAKENETKPTTDEDINCQGCFEDGDCYPLGYRKSGDYCSINLDFVPQFKEGLQCDNNFECNSNVCVSGECISGSLIQRILNWFRNLFG